MTSRPDPRLVLALVEEALDVDASERAAWLDARCDDTAVRGRVAEILAREDGLAEEAATSPLAGALGVDRIGGFEPGMQLGVYELLRPIGSGGMGAVWLAVRRDLGLEVALKVIRRGLDSDEVVARFHTERRVLASLQHPGIARLLDAGVTDDGRPFLVMELVEGAPLDEAVEGLDLDARLKLMIEICAAVSAAHRSLVVHRDLKPANVLVGRDGAPKLLDFGIAKLLDQNEDEGQTRAGEAAPLTPRYASPEQLDGRPPTVATDVFALGILLYELLAGEHPHEAATGSSNQVVEALRHRIPEPPSTVAARRGLPWTRQLRGDLDNVVLHALRKDPERRYASADQFAEDLQRYRDGFPVRARRDTKRYRVSKFIRRNRTALAAASIFLMGLVTALVWISLLYSDVSTARRNEQVQALEAARAGYAAEVAAAHTRVDEGDGLRAVEEMTVREPERRGWEWDRLMTRADRSLWRGGLLGSNRILDHFEGPRIADVEIDPEGRLALLACALPGASRVTAVSLDEGSTLFDLELPGVQPVRLARLVDSEGAIVGTSAGEVLRVTRSGGIEARVDLGNGSRIRDLAADPVGRRIAVTIWGRPAPLVLAMDDLAVLEDIAPESDEDDHPTLLAWSADGEQLAAVRRVERFEVLDVYARSAGGELGHRERLSLWSKPPTGLHWDARGRGIVVRFKDAASTLVSLTPGGASLDSIGREDSIGLEDRRPDGALLACKRREGFIDLVSGDLGVQRARLALGPGRWHARFVPGEDAVFCFSDEGRFGVWDASGSPATRSFQLPRENFTQVRVGARDSVVAVRSDRGVACILDLDTFLPLRLHGATTRAGRYKVRALDVHPTERLVVTADRKGRIGLVDLEAESWRQTLHDLGTRVRDLAYSPDGSQVVAGGSDGRVFLFDDLQSPPRRVFQLGRGASFIVKVAFSRDGERIAVTAHGASLRAGEGEERMSRIWELSARGEGAPVLLDELEAPLNHYSIEEHPVLARWTSGGKGCVRTFASGEERGSFPQELAGERFEDLIHDSVGRQAFLGGADGTISVLDAETGETVFAWSAYRRAVHDMEWVERLGSFVACSYTGELTLFRIGDARRWLAADRVRSFTLEDPDPREVVRRIEADRRLVGSLREEALAIAARLVPVTLDGWWVYALFGRMIANDAHVLPEATLEEALRLGQAVMAWKPRWTIDSASFLSTALGDPSRGLALALRDLALDEEEGRRVDSELLLAARAAWEVGDQKVLQRVAEEWDRMQGDSNDTRPFMLRVRRELTGLLRPDGSHWFPAGAAHGARSEPLSGTK